MNKNQLLTGITLAMVCVMTTAFHTQAETFEYPTKVIKVYDHKGTLINSHMSPDVQYIEVVDRMVEPKVFSANGTDGTVKFKMIPVLGTNSYKLRSNQIQWPENEKISAIKTFYIGETEVTNALWKAVMGSLPAQSTTTGDNYPVAYVSWNDICQANGFLDKLNQVISSQPGMAELMEEYEFALPNDWEWEYAACGGNHRDTYLYSGSNDRNEVGWFLTGSSDTEESEAATPHPVATEKLPNSLGIYDMSGNVWEWCSGDTFRLNDGTYNPDRRLQRGGGCGNTSVTNGERQHNNVPTFKRATLGLRLALKKKQQKAETYSLTGEDGQTVNFKMIPVAGTDSYGLKDTAIEWPETDKYATIETFYIGETEVTNALWKAVMGSIPADQTNNGDNFPVSNTCWNDICKTSGFLDKLNELIEKDAKMKEMMNGRKFCLPTEWEWEYAASGGNHHDPYNYSGSNNATDIAWVTQNSGGTTHEVATKSPNSLGIYDMSGNVWEWCSENQFRLNNGTYNTDRRPQRGGGFNNSPISIFDRKHNNIPNIVSQTLGLRLILK